MLISIFPKSRAWFEFAWLSLLLASFAASAAEFSVSAADITGEGFQARGIVLVLPEDGSVELRIAELQVQQQKLRDLHIRCASYALSKASVSCRGGSLPEPSGAAGLVGRSHQRAVNFEFDYRFATGDWRISARLLNAPAKAFAAFLPEALPRLTQGELSGTVEASGKASTVVNVAVDVGLTGVAFSDASGLHAGENLGGTIRLSGRRKAAVLAWQGDVAWESGEVFWNPLYVKGGYKMTASGSLDGTFLKLDQATVDLPESGHAQFAALWNLEQGTLAECTARGENLALGRLFADYGKPLLGEGALTESSLYGRADMDWQYRDGTTQSLRLVLREAGIADAEQRFALLGVNTEIDWDAYTPHTANIAFAGGALLGVPLGGGEWAVQMHGMEFSMAQGVLPVLDGELDLRDFRLARTDEEWHWQFAASLSQISMEQFSEAAGWPKMLGTVAGSIPKVSYDGEEISVDGELQFNVFDGTAVATQLKLADPFGRAPHLFGNVKMSNLDLDLLTHTFEFGNMQGRIDVDVNNLELQNWKPARFDARIISSSGIYPRKISQKAVQNISALGGRGAAAAIQRSYLRFFENFGYDRIGLSCVLRNGVCRMGGVVNGSGESYVIIKGGGIPAITVVGYNRDVSWGELVARLKRVTQGNMQAVIK